MNEEERLQYHKDYYYKNKKKINAQNKAWRQTHRDKCVEYQKKYAQTEKGRINRNKLANETKRKYPKKVKAQNKLNHLLENKLSNVTNDDFICAICGKQPIEKHHENYNLWNVFIPLCKGCHTKTRGS